MVKASDALDAQLGDGRHGGTTETDTVTALNVKSMQRSGSSVEPAEKTHVKLMVPLHCFNH